MGGGIRRKLEISMDGKDVVKMMNVASHLALSSVGP